MLQYRVYLRGELGKLAGVGDARSFLEQARHEILRASGIPTDTADMNKMFADQRDVDSFVEGLGPENLLKLTETCDRNWRRNGVARKLARPGPWVMTDAPVESIAVQQAESGAVGQMFERNGYNLVRIVNDPELITHEPYKSTDISRQIALPVCLAIKTGDQFRLFDGIHRAIHLVRQRKITICLVYPPAPA